MRKYNSTEGLLAGHFGELYFHRAKPVSEMERSGNERALRGRGSEKKRSRNERALRGRGSEKKRSGNERALRGRGSREVNCAEGLPAGHSA